MKNYLLLFVISFSVILHAQDNQSDSISIFDLTLDDLYNIQVTSASKTQETLEEAAATIYVITHQQIESRNYSSLAQLLYDIPRIIIQWKSSAENEHIYTINGIRGSDKFLVLLDGVRINSSIGSDNTIYESYSLENVKQVEVILGPASAIYGADAFSGVINIITYSAKDNPGVSYNLSYGQFNTYMASLTTNKVVGSLGFSFSSKIYHSDEPFYPKYYQDDYAWYHVYEQTGKVISWNDTVLAPTGIQPWSIDVDAHNVRMKVEYKNLTLGCASFYEAHSTSITDKPENAIYFDKARYYNLLITGYLKYHKESKNKKLSFNSNFSGQLFKILPYSAFVNIFTDYNLAYKYERSKSIKFENIFRYKVNKNSIFSLSLVAEGFDVIPKTGDLPVQYNEKLPPDMQHIYYFGSNITDYRGNDLTIYQDIYNLKYASAGGFVQYKKAFKDKFFLTLGCRFDYDTRYGTTTNPRVGLVYKANSKLKFKLLYGHAFLAPSPHVAYQHFGAFRPQYDSLGRVEGLTSGFFRLTNPNLRPEKIRTAEFDLSYRVYKPLNLKINFFHTNLEDYISWYVGQDTVFHGVHVEKFMIPVNNGFGLTYGFTVGAEYLWHFRETAFMLSSYYSYIDGHIDNEPLLFTSKNNFKFFMTVNVRDKFQFYFSAYYRDKSYFSSNAGDYSPSFVNTYFTANYRIVQKKNYSMSFYIKMSNLMDARYYNATDGTFGQVPQDPFRLNLGVKFSLF